MALKLRISEAELAKLDEAVQSFYNEQDGQYVLSVEGVEDTSGLKSALKKEREARAEYEKYAKNFQTLGKSPEEISELLRSQEEAEKSRLEQKGEWDKLKAQLLESHSKEMKAQQEAVNKMKQTLESYLVDANATEAIASAKGIPQLLLPHVKSAVRVVEEDGKYQVRVLGKDGTPRMNSKGEFLGIRDLVGEMRDSEVFSRAFEGSGTTGSGSPSARTSSTSKPFVISREDAKDARKYRMAKESAKKAGQDLTISET